MILALLNYRVSCNTVTTRLFSWIGWPAAEGEVRFVLCCVIISQPLLTHKITLRRQPAWYQSSAFNMIRLYQSYQKGNVHLNSTALEATATICCGDFRRLEDRDKTRHGRKDEKLKVFQLSVLTLHSQIRIHSWLGRVHAWLSRVCSWLRSVHSWHRMINSWLCSVHLWLSGVHSWLSKACSLLSSVHTNAHLQTHTNSVSIALAQGPVLGAGSSSAVDQRTGGHKSQTHWSGVNLHCVTLLLPSWREQSYRTFRLHSLSYLHI